MKFALKQIPCLLVALASVSGCSSISHEENKVLDQKVASEPPVANRAALQTETDTLTANTPGITDAQKQRLAALRDQVHAKLSENNKQSLALRSVLIKDVISPAADQREIKEIEKRLRSLSHERMETIFKAVDSANEILGRNSLIRESMDEEFLEQNGTFF